MATKWFIIDNIGIDYLLCPIYTEDQYLFGDSSISPNSSRVASLSAYYCSEVYDVWCKIKIYKLLFRIL